MKRTLGMLILVATVLAGCSPPPPAAGPPADATLTPVSLPRSRAEDSLSDLPSRAGPARNKLSAETARAIEQAERDPYWIEARERVRKTVTELVSQHRDELRRGLRHNVLMHGDRHRREIALTFDDGPHPGYTERLLEVLRREHVPATFFVVGQMAERYPELVRQEVEDGHEVANHTYHHVSLPKIPEEYVAVEIKACGEVLERITGRAPRLFRPPGGRYNDPIARVSRALGYEMVLWTDDPGDYESPGESVILRETLEDASNGGIILLHDGIEETINVLPRLIARLREEGYQFVSLDSMLPRKAAPHLEALRGT